jgi:hypothetical protein
MQPIRIHIQGHTVTVKFPVKNPMQYPDPNIISTGTEIILPRLETLEYLNQLNQKNAFNA